MKKIILLFLVSLLLCNSNIFSQNCPNSDFSLMNFDYWQAYTNTFPYGPYGPIFCCPTLGVVPGRHTLITQSMVDTNTCGGLTVPPPGYDVCAKLGNADNGKMAERLVYSFIVNPDHPAFIFKYAVVLELSMSTKPNTPYFSYKILDTSNTVVDPVCGYYETWAEPDNDEFHQCFGLYRAAVWRDWTTVMIDLSAYAGQQLSIEFTTSHFGGSRFGYAYITAECASLHIDQSFCPNSDSAILTVHPGLSYLWNTGDTTNSITVPNPVSGTPYNCHIYSSPYCGMHINTFLFNTILNPGFTFSHDTCSRTVSFTGTSTMTYGPFTTHSYSSYWDFGDGTVSTLTHPVHTYPASGSYNVTLNISVGGGCDSSINQTVTIGNVPVASFLVHDTCVFLEASFHNFSQAPDSIVHWFWIFGDGSPDDTTHWNPTHMYTVPGDYNIKLIVTNTSGCSDMLSQDITVYPVPVADFSYSLPVCSGAGTTIMFTGNSTPLTNYNWNFDGGTVVSGSGPGPYVISWPNPGNHQVSLEITDPICNSVSDTVKTLVVTPSPVANAGNDTTICLGHSITLSGSGGTSYAWSPPQSLSNPFISNPIASPTSQTTYHVTVTQNNCTSTDQVIISIEELSPVSVTPDTLSCGNKIQLNASGGSSYLWSPPTGLNAVNIPDPMAGPGVTTIYTVTISDSTGCQAIEDVTITMTGAISSLFNITIDTLCEGTNTLVYYMGGTLSPYATMSWNFNGAQVVFGSGIGPYSIHWNNSGNYTISLTVSELQCDTSSTTSRTIVVTPGPIAEAGPNDTICHGDSIALSASGGIDYSWWPDIGLSNSLISNPLASPDTSIMYHLYVYDEGCFGQDSVTIWVRPSPVAYAGPDTMLCLGDSIVLNASGGISYLWDPPGGLSSIHIPNPSASPLVTAIYYVTVTDVYNCSATDSITLTVYPKPTSTFNVDHNLICLEDSLSVIYTGSASATANYTWNFDGATIVSGSGQGPFILNWQAPGNYILSLTVDENNCFSPESLMTVKVDKVDPNISSFEDVKCFGDTNAFATVITTGGTQPYAFLWNTLQTSSTIHNLLPGMYIITVTDSSGCTGSDTIIISGPAAPLALNTITQNISCQNLCDGEIHTIVSGGTTPYFYSWNTNPVWTDSLIIGLCPGEYALTLTDNHGCDTTAVIVLPFNTAIYASSLADVTVGHIPLTVNFTFTGIGANSTLWDFGDNTTSTLSNPSHVYTSPGIFLVTCIIYSLAPDFCTNTSFLSIQVEDTSFIIIPNVFSPNGDGFNDYFETENHYILNFSIIIFNRWGTLIYESSGDKIHWDGKNQDGFIVPEGTYFFSLEATGKDGKIFKRLGVVTLLR